MRSKTASHELSKFEVIVGFAGGSRTAVEMVEATNRGQAGSEATDRHGCTAVVREIHEL
jgi:hypothetical protein